MNRYKMVLLLLLFVGIDAEILHTVGKSPVGDGDPVGLEPSRESIYSYLLIEQENVKGAGDHIKNAFDGLVANIHELIESDVLPNLQLQVDGVVDQAEETWINAGKAMRTAEVRSCIENSEADAQQVAKRAVEKMRGCAEALHQEGDRRVREATRLLGHIDAMTRRFIGALETCVKTAQFGDSSDLMSEEDSELTTPAPTVEAPSEDVTTASTATTCSKKSADDTSCSCPKCAKESEESTQQEGSQPKEKCKGRGKCEERKQKEKKGKKKDGKQVETGESENAADHVTSTEEEKRKKEKHGKKKEGKGKKEKNDSFETKGRKSRKLLAFEDDLKMHFPDPEGENLNDAQPQWRTHGANPEEQFVITCMQSPRLNELIEEKTRVYEKLEWVLNRVQEKEQGAQTLCIDEHLNKAKLKIDAIKARMASCAARYMKEEL